MKSYRQIANRHVFLKKKHFFLTLLGVVMSVALVTAMMTMMYSLVENLRISSIEKSGAHHIKIISATPNEAQLIKSRPEIEIAGLSYIDQVAFLGEYSDAQAEFYGISQKQLNIFAYDNNTFEILPFPLDTGRYPENSNEIIVDKWFIDSYDGTVEIGSTVILNTTSISQTQQKQSKTTEYSITGIISGETNISTNSSGKAITYFDSTKPLSDLNLQMHIRVNKKYNISKFIADIENDIRPFNIDYNTSLISLEGRDGDTGVVGPIIGIGAFLTAIILLATIAVIYNSFNISVLDKTSLYGLLRASGSTPKQVRQLVYREAAFYAVTGIPIGTCIGLLASYILLEFVGFEPFNFSGTGISTFISPLYIVIGIIIGLITVFVSSYIPAVRAGKVSPIEAINNKESIKLDNTKNYTKKSILGSFTGLPGRMASKNLKRNRKKFRVTIFSIIISSILFIVFNSLVVFSLDVNPYQERGFEYYIGTNGNHAFSDDDINFIQNIEGVENIIINDEDGNSIGEIRGIFIDIEDTAIKSDIDDILIEMNIEKPWFVISDFVENETQNRKLTTQLFIFFYGFLAVIILISSLNIVNTINTSLIQRKREFAILASVGMTRKQLSFMVVYETLIQGLKAGLIGSVLGVLLVYILYMLFESIEVITQSAFSIPWGILLISILGSVLISLLSCIAPMKKLRNQDIIATIRNLE